jgi:hypothetical protein
MAYHNRITSVTHPANADLSSHKFKIVELLSTNKVDLAGGGIGYGVLQNIPAADGEAATVAIDGETKVIAGEALTINDHITTKSGGWAIAVTSGDTPPLQIMGIMVTAPASGAIGTMHINRSVLHNVVSGSIAAGMPEA